MFLIHYLNLTKWKMSHKQVSSASIIGATIWEYEFVREQVKKMVNSTSNFFQQREKRVSFLERVTEYVLKMNQLLNSWILTVNFTVFRFQRCMASLCRGPLEASMGSTFTRRSVFSTDLWSKSVSIWIMANSADANDVVEKFLCKSSRT